MTDFTSAVDADGVAVITWDVPDRSMNVLTREAFALVEELIDRALADPAVKGIVITSGKDSFAGGMDLNVLASIRDAAGATPAPALFDFIMEGHRILRKLERAGMDPKTLKGGKPVACALPGTSAGIGTEIALACHRRFMADVPKARIGLPEILVGLFPGAGGTTRYSRMVGAMAAAPVLLEGKMLEPRKAKQAGLIDEVVPAADLLAAAKAWVLGATDADIVKPWDRKDWKMPGGAPYHPAGFMTFVGASAMVNAQTQGVYPAARALLSAVYEGALVPFDTALRIEARHFTSVLLDPTSSAMIRSLFLDKEALEKGANRPAVPDQRVRKLGVLGAGMMGAGIAHVAASAGIEVILIDQAQEAAERGKAHSEGLLDKGIARRKVTAEKKAEVLGRIHPTTDYAALAGCDLDRGGRVRGPRRKGRGDAGCRGRARPRLHLRHQHLHPADLRPRPRLRAPRPVHRHPLLLARGPHDARGDHPRPRNRRCGGRQGARFRPPDPQDTHRRERRALLLRQPLHHPLHQRGHPHGGRRRGARARGECGPPPRLPVGPLQLVDETSIDLGVRIAKATRAAMGAAYPDDGGGRGPVLDGRSGPHGPQGRGRLLRL
jgi:3-hydroxyacyl-CoA dehydrogenase / enoyl-CoA hydratase / 3-hydroxybutyryl-CoA epimerase